MGEVIGDGGGGRVVSGGSCSWLAGSVTRGASLVCSAIASMIMTRSTEYN